MPFSFAGTEASSLTSPSLAGGLRCLLLGIRGAGMSALAGVLRSAGHTVIGADCELTTADYAASSAADELVAWPPSNPSPHQVDVCIHTPAMRHDDPVLQPFAEGGIRIITLHEAVAELFRNHRSACVVGTHGKTTTSAMLAWILDHSGKHPSWFVGGELLNRNCSGEFGTGRDVVMETCEFSNAFQHLSPDLAILTGIERDHFDRYPQATDEDEAFRRFAEKVTRPDNLIVNVDSLRAKQVVSDLLPSVTTISLNPSTESTWTGSQIDVSSTGTTFTVNGPGGTAVVRLRTPGRHNVLNALAAIAGASRLGVSLKEAVDALTQFDGVRRRFEVRGQYRGAIIVDDYGHHPTAIVETLRTARRVFGKRRLVLVFEPHQMSRTEALFDEFVSACELADETLLLPVFPAREHRSHLECCRMSGQLVKQLNQRNHKAFLFANLDQIVSRIDHSLKPSDVCITMGAGTTNLIYDQLTRRLQRHSVA